VRTCVLLTGATGFLGTQIAVRLFRNTEHAIVALVRAKTRDEALHRLSRTWWNWPDLINAVGGRVRVVAGDISEPRLGLDDREYAGLLERVTHIIHAAADLNLGGPIDDLRRTNVGGTRHILELARAASHGHEFARFAYVSTAYVAGRRHGVIPEDALTDAHGFHGTYERSKYEAELLVRQAREELPVSIFRPGMVIGDSRTGDVNTFSVIYFPFRLYFSRRPFLIPARPSLKFNVVPVDYVADAVVTLTFDAEAAGRTFHLTAPWDSIPTARELIRFLRSWAREALGVRLPPPVFVPLPTVAARAFYQIRGRLIRRERATLGTLMAVLPYFNERRKFLRDNVDRLLGPYDIRWQQVIENTIGFAVARSFLHRPEETVHERVLSRLQSRSLPVRYHDIADGAVVTHSTRGVRDEMLSTAAAMQAMGLAKGDRVAVVGPNSTRYLTIDVAIGILGGVSLPIYNTSSVAEMREILSISGPKMLFVGNPEILGRLDEVDPAIPVVSFCRVSTRMPARPVIPWDQFLAAAGGAKAADKAPVTFGDMATIRFTSGTSGHVKAVCFDHANLRWMAESVCRTMNSWRAMNAELSYLSYLPMNHVVEGILTGYSPYYSSSAFNIFFLEDIKGLPDALRMVRPHVFFSVPRFYEKVWQALSQRALTRAYLSAREGARRRWLGRFLRRVVLRRAGLDRCGQLVVGSAPSSDALLRGFQDLGIEVYNAYGLTEAPLVTMNRPDRNRVGTVGEPLAETVLCVSDDGELLVSGPQVARGYLDGDACRPFENRVLHTGDLGCLTDEGSLVLRGRKKEIIVTSYGENLDPVKIESLLRSIPGVNEALVVGEGRPFCAAVLWVGDDAPGGQALASVERAITEVNGMLSHPEQVKRWAFLRGQPSIERGEMTASMKLKRAEMTVRLSEIVEDLYSGRPSASSRVIGAGGAS
jgi:long-chain acyl-CoA synthetase